MMNNSKVKIKRSKMRKRYIRYIIFYFLFLIFYFSTQVNAAVIGTTDDPMTIGGGARPIGMGRAFVAVAEDSDAPFINPAGTAVLKGPQAMVMYTNLLEEVYYREYSGSIPTPMGTVGIGYIQTGVNAIPTIISSVEVLTDYYDSLFLVSYSTSLGRYFYYWNNLFAGVNLKMFNRGYTGGINQYASGYSADFGLKLVVSPYLSLGICQQNFLPISLGGVIKLNSGAEEALAGLTKVGIAVRPIQFDRKLLIAADADLPAESGRPPTMHIGTEWTPVKALSLRCGLDQSVDPATASKASWNPAFGVSVSYGGFRFDYAYHPYYNYPSLATTYVSLSYISEPWFAMKGRVD